MEKIEHEEGEMTVGLRSYLRVGKASLRIFIN